jgi:hypothetical protein
MHLVACMYYELPSLPVATIFHSTIHLTACSSVHFAMLLQALQDSLEGPAKSYPLLIPTTSAASLFG